MLGVSDCIADCICPGVPQRTEWQCIGNQIDATLICASPQLSLIFFLFNCGKIDRKRKDFLTLSARLVKTGARSSANRRCNFKRKNLRSPNKSNNSLE
jgi:hypothetical protein